MTANRPVAGRPFSRHLADLVGENALLCPERPAVVSGDVSLSYAELDLEVDRFAGGLAGLGVVRGATVGILCTNRWEWLASALGAMRLGARVAAFNTFARSWDLDYMLQHSRTEVLVSVDGFRTRSYADTLVELVPGLVEEGWRSERYPHLRDVVLVGDRPAPAGCRPLQSVLDAAVPLPEGAHHTSAFDDAFVVYTSGSSARPKAVPLRHYAAIENGFSIGERMELTERDRVWASVPLFWSYGAVNATAATFTHRASLILQEVFEPREAMDLIERHQATVAYTLPNMTRALLDEPSFDRERVRSLRTGLTIGTGDDVRRAAEELGVAGICNIYGSTETYGNCCVTPASWPLDRRVASQGPALPGVSLRIVDQATGTTLGPGEVGELHVTGYLTRGYLDAGEGDNASFGPDGWYRTGDLGVLDEDGCFTFVARATEMIKTGGINVAPGEVEEFLMLHEQVRDAAVVGAPDPVLGEAVVAFVVPREPMADADELRVWCKARIAGFKIPARFHLVDELPKTDTGKLSRRRLVELDEAHAGP